MKIRIDPLDKLFSEYIRLRDKVCQRCGKANQIACAHFHGRARKSVRWDSDNACGLCMGCHVYLDSHAMEKVEFFRQRLGQESFDMLNSRMRNLWSKPDKEAIRLWLKEEIRKLD